MFWKLLITSFIVMSLSACTNTKPVDSANEVRKVSDKIDRLESRTKTREKNNIEFRQELYVAGDRVKLDRRGELKEKKVSFFSLRPVTISDAIRPVRTHGISVEINNNCFFSINDGNGKNKVIEYQGTVDGYLNYLKRKFNYEPVSRGNRVILDQCSTYTAQLPGSIFSSNMSMSVNVIESAPISGTQKQDTVESVVSTVRSMVGEQGEVVFSDRTGHIRIVSRPKTVDGVKAFLSKLIENQAKQVSIDVRIVQYSGDESSVFNMSGKIGYQDKNFQTGIEVPKVSADSATSVSGKVISGNFGGTELLLQSLYANKNVSIASSINLVGINSSPLPFNISTKRNYVKSITTEYDKDKNTEKRTYDVDSVDSGLELMILPTIDEIDNIDMTIMIKQKELLKLEKYENIQLPETTENSSFQRMKLQSGDTLVLTGFEENRYNNSDGSTVPGTLLLGGNKERKKVNRKIAILISPKVI